MRMRYITAFVVLVLCAHIGALVAIQNAYLVKRRTIGSSQEALSFLRRLLPSYLNAYQRCQRYTILLSSLTKSRVDQFQIADIGGEKNEKIMESYKKFDIESMRQLLIEGIAESVKFGPFDESILELTDCLSNMFRASDAKARSFLNRNNVQAAISQYKSIAAQPLTFLIDPSAKHPNLTKDQLCTPIKSTLVELFNGDIAAGESRFSTNDQAPAAIPRAPAQTGQPPYVVPAPAPAPAPYVAPAQVPVVASIPVPAQAPVHFPAPSDAPPSHYTNQPGLHDNLELSNEEHEYVKHIIDSLHTIYQTLPLEAKLYDRCSAYSSAIDDEKKGLDEIIKETEDRVKGNGLPIVSQPQLFIPAKSTRDNFLFVLSLFKDEQVGDETWVDIFDCVHQWRDVDEDVKRFMAEFEMSATFKKLTGQVKESAPTAS